MRLVESYILLVLVLCASVFSIQSESDNHSLVYKCFKKEERKACSKLVSVYSEALKVELDWFGKEDLGLKKTPVVLNLADKLKIFYDQLCINPTVVVEKENIPLCLESYITLYKASRFLFDPAVILIGNQNAFPSTRKMIEATCKDLLSSYAILSKLYITSSKICRDAKKRRHQDFNKICNQVSNVSDSIRGLMDDNAREISYCMNVLRN